MRRRYSILGAEFLDPFHIHGNSLRGKSAVRRMTSEVCRNFACGFKILHHIVKEFLRIFKAFAVFRLYLIFNIVKICVILRLDLAALIQCFQLLKEQGDRRSVEDDVMEIPKQINRLFRFDNGNSEQRRFHQIMRLHKILFVLFKLLLRKIFYGDLRLCRIDIFLLNLVVFNRKPGHDIRVSLDDFCNAIGEPLCVG